MSLDENDDRSLVALRRPMTAAPSGDLFEIDRAGTAALGHAATLRRYSKAVDPAASRMASEELCDLREATLPPITWRKAARVRPAWHRRGVEIGGRLERSFKAVSDRAINERLQQSAFASWWSLLRIGLSLIVAYAAATGKPAVAAGLMTLRLAVSITSGTSWAFPSDENSPKALDRKSVFGCIAGHVSDSIVLVGIMLSLFAHGRMVWGVVIVAALISQLLSTLTRVALLQVGIHLPRLRLERLMRAGGVLVALLAAAIWQPSVPLQAIPLVALLAAAPAFLFAAVEAFRTYGRLLYGEENAVTLGRHVLWPPTPAIEDSRPVLRAAVGDGCGPEIKRVS